MLRFAGILTGSALAIALIVATIGAPQFEPPARQPDDSPAAATAQREAPTPEPVEPPAIAASGVTPAATDKEDLQTAQLPQQTPPQPLSSETTRADDAVPRPNPELPQVQTANWYAFWSPFRSEIAADGFIARLQQTTGLDYRVVKLEPGVYEVAFAYSDDTDRAEKLQQISAATGLDLPGG